MICISLARGKYTRFGNLVRMLTGEQMKTKSLSLKISPIIGTVSAECFVPQKSKCIMTLAHGAGAGMHHSFMVTFTF